MCNFSEIRVYLCPPQQTVLPWRDSAKKVSTCSASMFPTIRCICANHRRKYYTGDIQQRNGKITKHWFYENWQSCETCAQQKETCAQNKGTRRTPFLHVCCIFFTFCGQSGNVFGTCFLHLFPKRVLYLFHICFTVSLFFKNHPYGSY